MSPYFKSKSRHTAIVEALNTVGTTTVGKVQRSKRDKQRDPRKQRKMKDWLKGE